MSINNNLYEYLQNRGVTDKNYLSFILKAETRDEKFKLFFVEGQVYMLSHFLDASDEPGYGLIKTNDVLGLTHTEMLAIALVEGDEVICINNNDNSICLLSFQSGQRKLYSVAGTFHEFLSMISVE